MAYTQALEAEESTELYQGLAKMRQARGDAAGAAESLSKTALGPGAAAAT